MEFSDSPKTDNIKVLLYSDDIVGLADSPSELQKMIVSLYDYCSPWYLNVNLDKSKVLVFRSSNRINSNLKFNYGSREIEIVNSYKYLGVEITFNLSYLKHWEAKLEGFLRYILKL